MKQIPRQQIKNLFGCTDEQLQRQYKANAATLAAMRDKANRTGRKVGNYTAGQLAAHAERYDKLANQ